jgi:hypothetical protein
MQLTNLEKKIERRISEIEQEKARLKENLAVVRQASSIASNFDEQHNSSDWGRDEPAEEPRARDSW